MRDAMECICQPMFLIAVDRQQEMRFVGLNAEAEHQTGLRNADMAGRTPHEALPVRMADTLLANYIRCLTSAASYAYEEVLELPRGVRHARTTLSPIFSDGAGLPRRVVGIVGVSTDITDHKHDLRHLTAAKAHLRRQCEDVATAATAMAQRMRGPLSLILS
ncbi:MAG: PAS domain-containing protein, partial [Pseudomonadota bacterium]